MRDDPGIDAPRMLAEAAEIAFPRYPGSAGDRRAIGIVARVFGEAGLEVEVEDFDYDLRPAFRAIRAALIGAASLLAAAVAASVVSTALALLLLAGCVLAGGLLLVWAPGAERLYAAHGPTRTSNVSGRRRAARRRMTLIVLAHHDSKSQNLTFPARAGLTLAALLGTLALAGMWLVRAASGGAAGPDAPTLAVGATTVCALLALSTLRNGNLSPGGVDNAGSLAIVFELARLLPARVAPDVELVFLSTGAEEDHMIGAMRWLAAHREELSSAPVYALNFDGAGAPGKAVLIERYGLGRPFSREISAAARAAAARAGIAFRGILMLPAMGVDAIPFAHAGVPCLTLSSGSLDRATISVHSANDVAENLDGETLARVARLGLETALELTGA